MYFLIRYIGFHLEYQKREEKFISLFRTNLENAHRAIMVPEAEKQGIMFTEHHVDIIRTTFLGGSCYIRTKPYEVSPWGETTRLPINLTATWFARMKALAKVLFLVGSYIRIFCTRRVYYEKHHGIQGVYRVG